MPYVVRFISAMMLACATLLGAPAAFAVDSGDIVVVSSKGEVHITVNGAARDVRAGGVLELPASVRTGRDGNVDLRQGATTVSVGPETLLEFPALEKPGAPIDRIVQPRGNAFYDIGKREGRKLRVETPYLVGVIKGTQFNVAARDEATTISLFEGLLEVRATDDSDVVDLKAGEIASRRRGDKSISIIKMDASKAPAAAPRPSPASSSNNDAPGPAVPRHAAPDGDRDSVRADLNLDTDVRVGGSSIETGIAATDSVDDRLAAATSAVVYAAGSGVDLGAAVSVGLAGADLATTIGVDAGPAAIDVGFGAGVNAVAGTVDVSTSVAVDAGLVTADLGTSTGVDLGAGTVDTSLLTSVDGGTLTTDVATDVAVDLGSGTVDGGVTVGASAPLVEVNVGADAAVDAVAGTVNLGLDVLGNGIDVGVSVPDTIDTVETVTHTVTDTVVDVGGLLDGLLRRPGRK